MKWEGKLPTLGNYMICTGTCGNGAWMGGLRNCLADISLIHGLLIRASTARSGVATGAITPVVVGRRFAQVQNLDRCKPADPSQATVTRLGLTQIQLFEVFQAPQIRETAVSQLGVVEAQLAQMGQAGDGGEPLVG